MIETDYLIVGAGTTGLAFADQLFTDTDATMTIVDRRSMCGGHWADSYPFVELHQPASFYGVGSALLGSGRKITEGLNAGMMALASGTEVLAHLQHCLHERLLPSGRVQYLPLHEVTDDRRVRSLVSGKETDVSVGKKFVNASFLTNAIPKTHKPAYGVAPEVNVTTPNEAPYEVVNYKNYVVVGAGKTGIDTVLFLLKAGVTQEQITWIMPRDSWLIDRATTQPTDEFFMDTIGSFVAQLEAAAAATDGDDFALRAEASGSWIRIDPDVKPTMFHAATCTRKETALLRTISHIIRGQRVSSIDPETIHLAEGSVPMPKDALVIDCTASAISKKDSVPIFNGDTITCQVLRFPLISFSAQMIAHLEATQPNDAEKNRFATPCPLPDTPEENLMTVFVGLMNQGQWRQSEEISQFLLESRLNPFSSMIANSDNTIPERAALMERLQTSIMPAFMNLQALVSRSA